MRRALASGSCALAGQPLAQRLALDVRHHVVEQAVDVARVVQRQDVRMVQPGGDVDLAEEPLPADRGGDLGVEDLDRDAAVVLLVLGQVDRGHPAAAQQARSPRTRRSVSPPPERTCRATHETSGAASAAAGWSRKSAARSVASSRRSTSPRNTASPEHRSLDDRRAVGEGRGRAPGPRPAQPRPIAPAWRHSSGLAGRHCGPQPFISR